MEINTAAIIVAKPINSEISNFVLRKRDESTVTELDFLMPFKKEY